MYIYLYLHGVITPFYDWYIGPASCNVGVGVAILSFTSRPARNFRCHRTKRPVPSCEFGRRRRVAGLCFSVAKPVGGTNLTYLVRLEVY